MELAALSEQLATKEADFAALGGSFARFCEYMSVRLGPLFAELEDLDAKVLEALAQLEPTLDRFAAAREARHQAEETRKAADEAAGGPSSDEVARHEKARHAADPDLRRLYKAAAKRFHPDLATDEDDRQRRTRLMAALNTAMDAGDVEAMQRLLHEDDVSPHSVTGQDVASRIVRTLRAIRQVKDRLEELARLELDLRADARFDSYVRKRVAWESGEDVFVNEVVGLGRRIRSAKARLEALRIETERKATDADV